MARVYPSGELAVSKVVRNSAARPPEVRYGPRRVERVGSRGRRSLRRAVIAQARVRGGSQFVLLTFTSAGVRSDEDMRHAFSKLLMWGRKYLGPFFAWYVWVAELQARGVLHFHLLLARRVPKALFNRLRVLWAETYGMGGGSVDIERMRTGKGAASYMSKYLGKSGNQHAVTLDGEGALRFARWPVSRHNGEPFLRKSFRGNPLGLSTLARVGTVPVLEFGAAVGAFPGLDGWHGVSKFYETPEEAVLALEGALLAGG